MNVRAACRLMAENHVGAVVVVESGRIAGIFTERDVLNKVLAGGLDPDSTALETVMVADPQTIQADRPLAHALHMMADGGFRPQPVIDGAISLAARCQAQLDAVSVGYESSSLPLVAEGGAAVASIFEVEREKALERAQAALAVFEAEAKRAGLVHSSRAISALQGEAAAILGATARLYDLAVVSQPEFARDTFDNTLSQEILFQSGGPVLFMPYTFKGAFQAKRVGICWDGSRLAARAVRDAMPLLEQAEAITVITINAANVPADATAAHLQRSLSRLKVPTAIDSR
jgi:CBS domain-containing protein